MPADRPHNQPGPVILVHTLAHAIAALRAAAQAECPVILASAPDAGIYAGPGWYHAMIAAARTAVPAARCSAWLDCGDDAGAVQAAIRAGIEAKAVERVVFTGPAALAGRLADIAGRYGVWIETQRPSPALDLADKFFATPEAMQRCCAEFLLAGRPAPRRGPVNKRGKPASLERCCR